MTFISL